MANNIERDTKSIYQLFSQKFGVLNIQQPKGYSNDVKSYNRDKDSKGILSKVDIDLEFFGDGAEYLRNIYYSLGIQEKVLLTKYEKNRYTLEEQWEIKYIQELDLGTFKEIERTGNVTVNSTEGGLYSDIKNRESDEYDLLENTSADGVDIGALVTNPFQAKSRKIFLESKLEGEYPQYRINGARFNRTTDVVDGCVRTVPVKVIYNSSTDDISTPTYGDDFNNTILHSRAVNLGSDQLINNLFFYEAEQQTRLKLKIDIQYKLTNIETKKTTPLEFSVEIFKTVKENAKDILAQKIPLEIFDPTTYNGEVKNATYNDEIIINKGDSLGIMFVTKSRYNAVAFPLTAVGYMDIYLNVLKASVVVEDITDYSQNTTITKCIKPLDFFDRLIAKITGKTGLVKSSLFEKKPDGTDGDYEYMVIDNGLWARNFPDVYKDGSDEEQRIQISTSFKDAFQSFSYIEPLVWFTEIIGDTEYLRIESAKYTQQNFIGISLGDVDKIEYQSSKIDYFSNAILGHSGSMEYEEINGLDESNGKSEFTSFISKNDSKYEMLSKFRTDAVGYELTKRKTFTLFPKEDTKRDEELWIHDAKVLETGVITHRLWQDIFDVVPTGIYDPDSSWNLWLSPINRLFYGHGYSIKRGLYHYPNKFLKFNSSNANQNLTTVYQGLSLSENSSIKIGDIPSARVEATMVNLTFKMTQELEKLFESKRNLNGEQVYNYFGLIEYNENGNKRYGRLVKLDSSDEAKLTLIKARI